MTRAEQAKRDADEKQELADIWAGGCHSDFVPGRELVCSARRIWSRRLYAMSGPRRESLQTPWRNYGECCGGPSCVDVDGTGSWGKHVRQYEDRENE